MDLITQNFLTMKKENPGMPDEDIWRAVATPPETTLDAGAVNGKGITPSEQIAALPTAPKPEPGPGTKAQDAVFNSVGPTGARLAPTDPEAVKEAYAKQYQLMGGGMGEAGRRIGGIIAGFGGNKKDASDVLDNERKFDEAQSIGLQAAQAKQGMEGVKTANDVIQAAQTVDTAKSELDMKKRTFLQDYALKGITVEKAEKDWEQAQKLYDPKSQASRLARAVAAKELGISVADLPPDMSALDLHDAMAGNKAYQEYFAGITARLTAEAQAGLAGAQAAAARQGTTQSGQVFDAVMGGQTPGGGKNNVTISSGPQGTSFGVAPSPTTTTAQQGLGETLVKQQQYLLDSSNGNVPRVMSDAKKALSATNIGTGTVAQLMSKQGVLTTQGMLIRNALVMEAKAKGYGPKEAEAEADAIFSLPREAALQRINGIITNHEITKGNVQRLRKHIADGLPPEQYAPIKGMVKDAKGNKAYVLENGQYEEIK